MIVESSLLTPISMFSVNGKKIVIIQGNEKTINFDDIRNFFSVVDLCFAKGIDAIYIDIMVPEFISACAHDAAKRRGIQIIEDIDILAA